MAKLAGLHSTSNKRQKTPTKVLNKGTKKKSSQQTPRQKKKIAEIKSNREKTQRETTRASTRNKANVIGTSPAPPHVEGGNQN